MFKVLRSVVWGEAALALLSKCNRLDPGRPAVMHIRHTERPVIDTIGEGRGMLSTPRGKEAAFEFGAGLPESRRYRLFHTYYDRAKETALKIQEGIKDRGSVSKVGGAIPVATVLDHDAYMEYLSEYADTDDHAKNFFRDWTSKRIPSKMVLPSLEFAREMAQFMMDTLRGARHDSFDIYVSHDVWVAALMFHWFGLKPHDDWYTFLDGFIMQLGDEGMTVYYRDEFKAVPYPSWWPR